MSLWRDREFLKLWVGQTISEVGSRITREGIPWTAVGLLGATPAQMAVLTALNGAAAVAFGPIAGVVADRMHRRPILIVADLGRALVLAAIPLLAITGTLRMWHLLIVAFLAGVLTIFFDVGYQSYLPSLVKPGQLLEGNRKLALTQSTAEVLGPGITGVLVGWLTAPRAIAIDAISFVVSAMSVLAIRRPEAPVALEHEEPGWAEFTAGFGMVRSDPTLRALALRAVTAFFFYGFFATLYMFYAIQTLGLTPIVLGFVITLGGVGNLFGALIAERLAVRWPVRRVLICSTVYSGVLALLIPLGGGPWYVAAAFLGASQLLGDVANPIYNIHEVTLRQQVTPQGLLGRVNACMQLLSKGIFPVGALAGGLLAERYGPRPVLTVAALGVMASAGWLVGVRTPPTRYETPQ